MGDDAAGCHVAKVEGEAGKGVFVRRDGKRGNQYDDVSHPLFSLNGSALACAVRGRDGSFFVIDDREGPAFAEVISDSFVFSPDGKRHAYLAKRDGRLVAVIDGKPQVSADGDLDPWLQPPVFSPNGRSVAYLEGSRRQRKMCAVVNGERGPPYDGIDLHSLTFSPDGSRCAYCAFEGGQAFRVIAGNKGRAFDSLGIDFLFSPDGKRTAYAGRDGGKWYLVLDEGVPQPIEGITDHTLTFSPDSKHLAYAAAKADRSSYIVVDGKAGPVYDGIGASLPPGNTGPASVAVTFSPDSRKLAYLASKGDKKFVVVDNKPEEVGIDFLVGQILFSPDSKRLAYGGRRANRFFLVTDGTKGTEYDALGHFEFSQDGKHVAFVAQKAKSFVISVDGIERAEYLAVPAGPVFRSDGALEFLATDDKSLYRVEAKNLPDPETVRPGDRTSPNAENE